MNPTVVPVPDPLSPVIPEALSYAELRQAAERQHSWLWHGFLVAGGVTLLTSQWKSGKTTLVSVLLEKLKAGGTLAGLPVAAGKAVIVSEESPAQWELRGRQLDFAGHLRWLCRPFRGKPSPAEWLALIDRLAELHDRHGLALVVVDPLATFLPGRNENQAGVMIEALAPLQRLTTRGVSVLLLHHPRKQDSAEGRMARGSGALPGFADILIEMDWLRRGDPTDRRRQLRGWSRYLETPRHLVMELTQDGRDYAVCGDALAEEFTDHWRLLRMVLEDADHELTRREMLDEWPADFERPSPATLWSWLQQAVSRGLVCQDGTGRKNSPFRYWLPAQQEKWQRNPLYRLRAAQQKAMEIQHQLRNRIAEP